MATDKDLVCRKTKSYVVLHTANEVPNDSLLTNGRARWYVAQWCAKSA